MQPIGDITKAQEKLALLLSLTAGYVDSYGYITYKTFLSLMSGNTTQAGLWLGEGGFKEAALPLTAILFFVIGITIGTLITHSAIHKPRRLMFAMIAILHAVILAATQLELTTALAPIATLSFAMGMMNTALRNVGAELLSLTFVTGTLSRIANHIALIIKREPLPDAQGPWDTPRRRTALLTRIWGCFLIGALLSGTLTPRLGAWVLLLPILILLILIIINPVPTKKLSP